MEEPDWSDIRIFLAIAETGSMTGAAERLGISQPTVGRRLRVLEQTMGGPLVERLPNRLEITAFGRELAVHAAAMGKAAAAVLRRMDGTVKPARPLVRISATGSLALFLAGRLGDLRGPCPGIDVALVASRRRANLAEREAEIAVRMRRPPEEGDVVTRRVGRFAVTLYGVRAIVESRRGSGGIDLAAFDHIGPAVDGRRSAKGDWLAGLVPAGRIVARIGETAARHAAVRSGAGVGLLPCFLGDPDPDLTRLMPPPPELAEDMFLLIHGDLKDRPPVRALAEAMATLFARHAAALSGG